MLIRDVMTKSLVTVPADATIRDAARALVEHDISAAPVVDEHGQLVGLVSEIDLIRRDVLPDQRAHARRIHPEGGTAPRTVAEVMTRDVVTVPPGADVADAVAVMSDMRVKSLPVLDDGRLAGIIARRDVVRVLLRDDDLIRAEVARRLAEALPYGPWLVRVTDGIVELGAGAVPRWSPVAASVAATVPGVVRVVVGNEQPAQTRAEARESHGDNERRLSHVIHLARTDDAGGVDYRAVHDVMSTSLLTVRAETRVAEARALMIGIRVHHVPVVDTEGRVVGVLDADLLAVADDDATAGEVASRHATVTVAPGDSLRFVAHCLDEHGRDVAAVTTYDGRLIGLVTDRDIVAAVGGEAPHRE